MNEEGQRKKEFQDAIVCFSQIDPSGDLYKKAKFKEGDCHFSLGCLEINRQAQLPLFRQAMQCYNEAQLHDNSLMQEISARIQACGKRIRIILSKNERESDQSLKANKSTHKS